MIKFITRFIFTIAAVLLSASAVLAQNTNLYVIDSFGDHTLPGWYSGGRILALHFASAEPLPDVQSPF